MSIEIIHKSEIEKRNGTIRSNRLSKDLLDNPFQIDGRSTWDVLAFMVSYLEKINYYNLENIVDGDWENLVDRDPLIYMASIINKPTDDIDNLIRDYDVAKIKNEGISDETIGLLFKWWGEIHEWSENLIRCDEKELAITIKNSLINGITFNRNYIVLKDGKPDIEKLKENMGKSDNLGIILEEVLHDFQKAIRHIKESTKTHFSQKLLENNAHLPHTAMYITFMLLFRKLQTKLNGLSIAHLDFYYKKVLKQQFRKGNSARAVVNFELQPMIKNTLIPKGTKLSAGKILGSKSEILFKTNKDLMAYQAELVNIQTLFINSNTYIDIGTKKPIISSIACNRLYKFSKDQVSRKEWYVFGANKKSKQDSKLEGMTTANIGFIIGSPVLFLSEGKRHVSLQVNLNVNSQTSFWTLLNEIKQNREIAMSTVISRVFDKAFNIFYSNKKGWMPCAYLIDFSEEDNYFTFKLLLDYADPSLELSDKNDEDLTWPSIKVELNETAPVYAYSFFNAVEIDTIHIDVEVHGMKNLSCYNNVGKMPIGKSFELFGHEPKKGNYFIVGHSELFKKQVKELKLQLEWEAVPNDYGGFESYYDDYGAQIDNQSFKVQFSALSNGYWFPSQDPGSPVKNLFTTSSCLTPEGYRSEQLNDTRLLEFDNFLELGINPDHSLKEPLIYDVSTQGGFVKMTFCAPDFGFASDLYVEEFTEIATYNAKNKKQFPYPNKPFIPKIKGVSIHYKASDTLFFSELVNKSSNSNVFLGEFKHITPFIVRDVIVDQLVQKNTLLPNFTEEGYLILGLKGVKSNTEISVYFHFMRSSSTGTMKENPLKWEYFSLPDWKEFDLDAIIRDDTEGFLKSGIVQLFLPDVDDNERGIDPDILWIRVSTKNDAEKYPKIKGVYLNAVDTIATSIDPSIIGKKIKEESIHKLFEKFPDVKKVYQAAETFGERIPEVGNPFYTRVSERLRHKGRAVTLWDYERLILDNFDDVLIAKCTSFNEHFKPIPGHVKVVVLSTRWTQEAPYYFSKMKLKRMKKFLNKISSSFINIEVVNPKIEYLLVNCKVEFNKIDIGLNYRDKLREDMTRFLSPISEVSSNKGGIGGSVMPSTLANYVENLPYIKLLKKFNMEHIIKHGENNYSLDVHDNEQIIFAQTPWSILTPLNAHRIVTKKNVKDRYVLEDLRVGVGIIEVGLDLIIGEEHKHKKNN